MADLTFSKHDPDPVGTALGTRGARAFHDALEWVVHKTDAVTTEKLPPELRMIRVLWWLDFYHDNLDYFLFNLERGFAPHVPDAQAFCRQIDAPRTAKLLAGLAKLFPEGMPETDRAYTKVKFKRDLEKPIARVQKEFKDFPAELRSGLRKWLRANQVEVRSAIDRVRGGPAAPGGVASRSGAITQPSQFDAVIGATDDDPVQAGFAFMSAAVDWIWSVPNRKGMPFDELPESARMIVLLNGLVSALHSAGLLYVADWDVGDDFTDLRRWIGQIGAVQTGEYLDRFAALFPGKRVPKDRDKRSDALQRVVERANAKGTDPLDVLDDEFQEVAMREMPARLREWMLLHRGRIEQEQRFAAAQPEGASGDDLLLKDDHFLAQAASQRIRIQKASRDDPWFNTVPVERGDVMALKTKKGFAYLQASHVHAYSDVEGHAVRVIEGFTKTPLTGAALEKHVKGATRYFRLLRAGYYLVQEPKRLTIVGRGLPIPKSVAPFPSFLFYWGKTRDGRAVFGQWDGGERPTRHLISPLTDEQLQMNETSGVIDMEWLAGEIADPLWTTEREHMGWYPEP